MTTRGYILRRDEYIATEVFAELRRRVKLSDGDLVKVIDQVIQRARDTWTAGVDERIIAAIEDREIPNPF